MDFLDPRKRRSNNLRLLIGYALMAIAIGLGALILVYGANGYGINTKTGEIIQNGLLFVDSNPGGAEIFLNGQDQHTTTSARLVLPAGKYTLTLKKAGYGDWTRNFTLEEHSIARYVYPFLFPTKAVSRTVKVYPALPEVITQTPDRRWLLVQSKGLALAEPATFDLYDLKNITQPGSAKSVSLPADLLSSPPGASASDSRLQAIEWSTDNNHLLLKHEFSSGSEFIILDRNDPTKSINVNKTLQVDPSSLALFNKKADQLYIYDKGAKTVRLGNIADGTVGKPLLKDVLAFKSYGSDLILYVTASNQPSGKVQARIWNKGTTYPLYTFKSGDAYLINLAQFQGHWYYVAGSSGDPLIDVFKDPLDSIRDPSVRKAVPMLALRESGANKVLFSDNTRFVEAEAGQDFAVYDFETQSYYRYQLPGPIGTPARWMDGHRLLAQSQDKLLVVDYDSTNPHELAATTDPAGGYFSSDYSQLLVMEPVSGSNASALTDLDMRAGVDLPKSLQ